MTSIEDKKKRGRPKKIAVEEDELEIEPNNDKLNLNLKKRGRKKKTQMTNPISLPLKMDSDLKPQNNYIIMLDIKLSDLDGSSHPSQHPSFESFNNNNNSSLSCNKLISLFSNLITQKRLLLETNVQLKTVHEQIMSPESCQINFLSDYDQRESNMTVLPVFKLNGDGWPQSSSYNCWNCDSQFDNSPIGIPEHYSNNNFYCYGNFCSFPCACRYVTDNDHSVNRFEKISLLNSLYQQTLNLPLTEYIKIANPKQTLHKYGGCLSYNQYHDSNDASKVHFYKLPIIPVYYYICNENLRTPDNKASQPLADDETVKDIITFK